MPSRILLLAACVLVLPWPGSAAQAQDAATPFSAERPRIGLVLSGGGARGAAHVGVIRALEQMRIPIDAVAGTSMGAVVGGLYAAGLSGEEIDTLFRTLDWQELLRDRAPRRVHRRRSAPGRYADAPPRTAWQHPAPAPRTRATAGRGHRRPAAGFG
jgi:NTE family protein